MKKKKRVMWVVLITMSIFICTFIAVSIYYKNKIKSIDNEKKESVIKRVHTTYKYDVNNLGKLIGDADYVFVAKVDKKVETVYKYPVKKEDSWISSPYTKYRLEVKKNIKGQLRINKKIIVSKSGGEDKYNNVKYIYDKDILPKKGEYFVFMAYAQKDGSMLVTGANSNLRVTKNYTTSSAYRNVIKSMGKVVNVKRTRYKIKNSKVYV